MSRNARQCIVPSADELRALDDLLAWAAFEPPPVETLTSVGATTRIINALRHNGIRFMDQYYQVTSGIREHFAARPLTDMQWYQHPDLLGRKLERIGPKQAVEFVPLWDAWAQSEPQQAAQIMVYNFRRPSWRAKQMVLAFLRDGLRSSEIAKLYGITNQRVFQLLESAGLGADLRHLYRINQAWARQREKGSAHSVVLGDTEEVASPTGMGQASM